MWLLSSESKSNAFNKPTDTFIKLRIHIDPDPGLYPNYTVLQFRKPYSAALERDICYVGVSQDLFFNQVHGYETTTGLLYQFGAVDGMLDKGNRFLHHKSHMT
jgi:hypothetical protein